MKKVLIIGSTVVDIIVNLVDSLPKTGEDVHIRSQHMSLGGCAYNVSDSVRHFQVPYILFSPVGQGVYGHFVREELKKRGISSPIPSPDAENGCCYCFVEKSGERSFISYHGAEYLFEKSWFDLIDVSEIDKIELSGTTGGKDGNYSYTLSDQEKKEFVHLLNQVKLGDEVDKNQALSSGAVTYYKLYFQGKDVVTLCPGHYFGVDEKYYKFVNFDELWDEFVTFNSKQDTSQQDKWDCSVACAETSETNNYVVTYSDKKVFSQTGILTFQNSNNFNIIVHLQIPDEEERTAEIPAGGVSSLYQISQNKASTVGVYADVPENETIKLMVYDGAVADLNSSQEKEQVYFDATVLEVKKKSIKVKCSESFDSGIPVDEEFSVTTNRVESGELPDLNAGDHIRIVFDGIIKESYPLQLGNVFAIYLLDENGNL